MEAILLDGLKSLFTAIASGFVALVLGWLVFKPAMAGRRIEARKLDVDAQKAVVDGALSERKESREDKRDHRDEVEFLLHGMRDELARMRSEREQDRARTEVLVEKSNRLIETMAEMKGYIIELRDFIRRLGHEPPKPPRDWFSPPSKDPPS